MINDSVFNFIFSIFSRLLGIMRSTVLFSFHGFSVTIWQAMVTFALFNLIMFFFFGVFGGGSDE